MLCPSALPMVPMVPMVPTRTQRADRQGTTLHNRMTQRWRFPNDSTMHCRSSIADPPCSRVSCAHCVQNPWCRILWGPLGPVCCTLGFCLFNQLNIAQRWKQLQHHETSHVSLVFGKTSVLSSESWGKGDAKRAEGEGWASHSIPFLKDLERTHSFALVQERREYTRIAPQHIAPSSYIPEMSRNQSRYVRICFWIPGSGSGSILNIL